MTFLFLVPKVNGYQPQKKLVSDFLKISKTCHYLSFGGGGFNFRLGTYNVPSGSSAPSLKKEAEGRASAKREFDGVGSDRIGR